MRISTAQIFDTGVRNMGRAQAEAARTQAQLGSAKRVLSPADDPAAATTALALRQDKARSAQYQRNADLAEHELRQQELGLDSVEKLLLDVKDLVMQAGNATLSVDERASIVGALRGMGEQLLALFNTRTAGGDYLFAGASADEAPFVVSASGQVEYRGDTLARQVDVGAGVAVQSRSSGRELFVDVPASAPSFLTRAEAGNSGSASISIGRIIDPAAYASVFPDDLSVSFPSATPGEFVVNRVDRATGTAMQIDGPNPYTPGDALTVEVAGVQVTINGTPAVGDSFTLEARRTQSIALTVQRLADGLAGVSDTPQGAAERGRVVASALADLDQGLQSLGRQRVAVGTRLAQLDTARDEQRETDLLNDELTSSLVDLDLEEAASRLAFQTLVLQAAQQSFAKIAGLSLFSFLR